MLDRRDVAVADDDVGLALEQGLEQRRNLVPGVLIVGVGVDDEVGAAFERGVDAGGERRRQALVAAQPDDVIDAGRARDIGRAVARSVVDDQDFDDVDARDGIAAVPPASPAACPPR